MKAAIKVELAPLQTPNFVRAKAPPEPLEAGFEEAPCYPLSELDPETLEALCEQFTREVFKKAGKARPVRDRCGP